MRYCAAIHRNRNNRPRLYQLLGNKYFKYKVASRPAPVIRNQLKCHGTPWQCWLFWHLIRLCFNYPSTCHFRCYQSFTDVVQAFNCCFPWFPNSFRPCPLPFICSWPSRASSVPQRLTTYKFTLCMTMCSFEIYTSVLGWCWCMYTVSLQSHLLNLT